MNFPDAQLRQEVALPVEYFPLSQIEQTGDPSSPVLLKYFPAVQPLQPADPSPETSPLSQSLQSLASSCSDALSPLSAIYFPDKQDSQEAEAADEYVPLGHITHVELASELAYLPVSQPMQSFSLSWLLASL